MIIQITAKMMTLLRQVYALMQREVERAREKERDRSRKTSLLCCVCERVCMTRHESEYDFDI